MVRRASRPRARRAPGIAIVIAAAVLAGTIAHPVSRAQPAPEVNRARDLYQAAEAAMKAGRFSDAARDYGAAYDASKDPALLFKMGRAHERAGECPVALIYYARYLREGQPNERFATTTRERITACGGVVAAPDAGAGSAAPAQTGSAADSAAVRAPTSGTDAERGSGAPADSAERGSGAAADSGATTGRPATTPGPADSGSASTSEGTAADASSGSATPEPIATPTARHKVAWVLAGGAIALASLGGILAYATNSSENDVRDLYVGLGGQPPTFDARTRESYDDLVDQGHRYQQLSWAAFGVAGAAAIGAAVMFVTGRRPTAAEHARITPVVTPRTAGVVVRF